MRFLRYSVPEACLNSAILILMLEKDFNVLDILRFFSKQSIFVKEYRI